LAHNLHPSYEARIANAEVAAWLLFAYAVDCSEVKGRLDEYSSDKEN
jgi:hypothetical protein